MILRKTYKAKKTQQDSKRQWQTTGHNNKHRTGQERPDNRRQQLRPTGQNRTPNWRWHCSHFNQDFINQPLGTRWPWQMSPILQFLLLSQKRSSINRKTERCDGEGVQVCKTNGHRKWQPGSAGDDGLTRSDRVHVSFNRESLLKWSKWYSLHILHQCDFVCLIWFTAHKSTWQNKCC